MENATTAFQTNETMKKYITTTTSTKNHDVIDNYGTPLTLN